MSLVSLNTVSTTTTMKQQSSSMPQWLLQLEEELDYRLLVRLRDGRIYIGILRSFDQYGNLLLDSVCQRLSAYHPELKRICYADIQLGSLIIRGDSMMLFGRMKDEKEESQHEATTSSPPPIPLSSISPSDCQMIERPLQEVSKLLLEYDSIDDKASAGATNKNFLWSQLEHSDIDPYL